MYHLDCDVELTSIVARSMDYDQDPRRLVRASHRDCSDRTYLQNPAKPKAQSSHHQYIRSEASCHCLYYASFVLSGSIFERYS